MARRSRADARNTGRRPRPRPIPSGSALPAGDRTRGLRLVADAFYRGPIARRIDAWSSAHGGLIRYVDLATHTTRVEEPVAVEYHGLTVYKCGPWTQGPYLLEALQILKDIDLKAMGHNRPDAVHTIVETMKLALADRDTFYADPLFAEVPLAALLSPEYAALRRGLIDPKHASLERRPGDPRGGKAILDPAADPARRHVPPPPAAAHDTTTCVVADRFGNVVAATPSGWSGVVAGDTGVWLGSRLQSFNVWNDHPNVIEPGQAPADHLVAHAGAARQQARAGHQRGRRRQPGPDDLAALAQSFRIRPRSRCLGCRPSVHDRPLDQLVPSDASCPGQAADQPGDRHRNPRRFESPRTRSHRQFRAAGGGARA